MASLNILNSMLEAAKSAYSVELSTPVETSLHYPDKASFDIEIMSLAAEIDDLHSAFNEVAAVVQRLISHIRYRQNMLQSVNTLPPEVLCNIFREASKGSVERYEPARNASWQIAQTCAYWRNISIDYPPLWSDIFFHRDYNSELVSCLLDRSRNYPISVMTPLNTPRVKEFWALCSKHLNHIRAMDVAISEDIRKTDDWQWLCDEPAPILSSLEVSFAGGLELVLPRLFSGNAPCLKTLIMRNCRLPWAAGYYRDLTKLRIISTFTGNSYWTGGCGDGKFIEILRDCPNLEELSVASPNCSYHPSTPPSQLHTISLKYLRFLYLNVPRAALFLDYILARCATPSLLEAVCTLRNDRFHIVPDGRLPGTASFQHSFGKFRALFVHGVISPVEHQPSDPPPTTPHLYLHGWSEHYFSALVASLKEWHSLDTLQHLAIFELRCLDEVTRSLVDLFERTSAITHLTYSGQEVRVADDVWEALAAKCEASMTLWPALEFLDLHGAKIDMSFLKFLEVWKNFANLRKLSMQQCKFRSGNEHQRITECDWLRAHVQVEEIEPTIRPSYWKR